MHATSHSNTRNQPGFIIAGTHSGCGKTTVTMGLIAALSDSGIAVQPYKCGPDFIDPGFHSAASGRICRNLDTRMLDESGVVELYSRTSAGSDITVIEGVMGLFDGAGPHDERGSAAHISRLLGIPVILVIEARAMARSAAAIALGFAQFDPEVRIAGIVLNRLGSQRHADMTREAVESVTGIPVIATLLSDSSWEIPSRHLGLATDGFNTMRFAGEDNQSNDRAEPASSVPRSPGLIALAAYISGNSDLSLLKTIASTATSIPQAQSFAGIHSESMPSNDAGSSPLIAVAHDEAFWFYYPENIELLIEMGARITTFSPLSDATLPEGCSAVYIGGGYPELHGERLANNSSMLESIRSAAERGMPIYAECGGFMYLNKTIVDAEERNHSMAGIFPGTMRMGAKLRALGYADADIAQGSPLGPAGSTLRGHVFHWANLELTGELSSVEAERTSPAFTVEFRDEQKPEGFQWKSCMGSWLHLHFLSNPQAARSFVESARNFAAQ